MHVFVPRRKDMANMPIKAGMDVNRCGDDGRSVLHFARERVLRFTVELMLARGAQDNPNVM